MDQIANVAVQQGAAAPQTTLRGMLGMAQGGQMGGDGFAAIFQQLMGAHAGTQSQTLGRALETLEKKEVLLESEGLRTPGEHSPQNQLSRAKKVHRE